jgi:hypothetical protein
MRTDALICTYENKISWFIFSNERFYWSLTELYLNQ